MSLKEWNASSPVRQDSHPNRDGSGNDCPVQGNLDVLVILVVLDVLVLLNPAETNKVDRRMLDALLVEEFDNL